jgi:hypothetical protein
MASMQELPDFEEKAPVITEDRGNSREVYGGMQVEREREIDGYIYII